MKFSQICLPAGHLRAILTLLGIVLANFSYAQTNLLVNGDFSSGYAGTLGYNVSIQTTQAGNGWYRNPNTARCFTTISNGEVLAQGSQDAALLQLINDGKTTTNNANFSLDVTNSDSDVQIQIFGYNGNASTVNSKLNANTNSSPPSGGNADATLLSTSLFASGTSTQSFDLDLGIGYDYLLIAISAKANSANTTRIDNVSLTGAGTPPNPTPNYTLTINATNGSVSKSPNQSNYPLGTVVTLSATPDVGYQFDGWSGDASGNSNPLDVTMNADKNISANFSQIPTSGSGNYRYLRLTVLDGVSSSYAPNIAEIDYFEGSSVYPGSNITGNSAQVSATVSQSTAYQAFDGSNSSIWGQLNTLPARITLDAGQSISPDRVEITPAFTGRAIKAFQVEGSSDNSNWSLLLETGGLSENDWAQGSAKSFNLGGGSSPTTYTLSVSATNGSVSKSPNQSTYTSGESVTLAATPNSGYQFDGWSGDASGTSNPLTVTMNANKNITANFSITPGGGSGGTTRLEAEEATWSNGVLTNNASASGGQFVDGNGGFNITWNFNASSSGSYDLQFAIAAPSGTRKVGVFVNNSKVGTVTTSASRYNWEEKVITANLSAGSNTIEFRDTEGMAEPDVDYLDVVGGGGSGDTQAPSRPTGLTQTGAGTNFISISWNASSDNVGVTEYQVYRNGSLDGTSTNTSYTASGLSANTSYNFYVVALDQAGNASTPSSTISASTQASSGGGQNSGSPVGTNLSTPERYTSEMPFINLTKQAEGWTSFNSIYKADELPDSDIQEDGYLKPGKTGQLAVLWSMNINGNYVATYDGSATVSFKTDNEGSGATIVSNTPGRIEVSCNNVGFLVFQVLSNSSTNPLRNLRITEKQFENNNATFHPDFLDNWRKMKSLRFMDWMEANNSQAEFWANRPEPNDLVYDKPGGVPVEVLVELSNELQADPWFTMPHKATDNYMQQFATIVKNTLDPNLKIYIEYSNEVWNGQFSQHGYSISRGKSLGLSGADVEAGRFYTARRSVQMFQIWENVFGGSGRLVRLLPSQAANPSSGTVIMDYRDAQWNGQRAADFADALTIAPYFGGTIGRNDNFVLSNSVDAILDESLKQIRNQPFIGTDNMHLRMKQNIDNAANRGLKTVAYEGGQHLSPRTPNNQAITDKLVAANRAPRMKDVYIEYFEKWLSYGGDLFASFSSVSTPGRYGSWGVKEYTEQPRSQSPKYDGLLTVIETNPVNWQGKFFTGGSSSMSSPTQSIPMVLSPGEKWETTQVYPNPAKGILNIKSVSEEARIQITDLNGKILYQEKLRDHRLQIPRLDLQKGMYILILESEAGVERQRILVEE